MRNKEDTTSDLCPCCEKCPEDMKHMLCCPSEYATDYQFKSQETLISTLRHIDTPEHIISAIIFGLSEFVNQIKLTVNHPPNQARTGLYILVTC
jgi:hypothetical protein